MKQRRDRLVDTVPMLALVWAPLLSLVWAAPAITPIHAIQGRGATATAGTFTVEAIVVGAYQTQGAGQLRGFFLQEEDADADADPATSEGIFVFCRGCPIPVSVATRYRSPATPASSST